MLQSYICELAEEYLDKFHEDVVKDEELQDIRGYLPAAHTEVEPANANA